MNRGFFAIGIENAKFGTNFGTLFRSAHSFGAQYIFTIGERFQNQRSDTTKVCKHVPYFYYESIDHFFSNIPRATKIIGVETDTDHELPRFVHPERAIYVLGAEDKGLSKEMKQKCDYIVSIPGGKICLNVSVAGSIIMYDRFQKSLK